MRFSNYFNKRSNRNRIYSHNNILRMNVGEFLDREDELDYQNNLIGFPDDEELKSSPNIEAYTDDLGNQGWRSKYDFGLVANTPNLYKYNGIINQQPFVLEENPSKNVPVLSFNNQDEKIDNDWDYVDLNNIDEDIDKNIIDYMPKDVYQRMQNNKEYTDSSSILKGHVQKNDDSFYKLSKVSGVEQPKYYWENKQDKPLLEKYKGLGPMVALQKAMSKLPIDTVEREYYGLSSALKDGDPLSEKVQDENDFYRLKDIQDPELAKIYEKRIAEMYNIDPNDPASQEKIQNAHIVVPKDNSRLKQYVLKSSTMEKWLADNYERIKNEGARQGESIEFPKDAFDEEKRALYGTLHRGTIDNIKINEDGSFTSRFGDGFDFNHWNYKKIKPDKNLINDVIYNAFTKLNNNAATQQEANQLENYYLSFPVNYSKEEIERILKKYGKI